MELEPGRQHLITGDRATLTDFLPRATVRRNSLFAGSDAGARSRAMFTSLIQTARLNDIDPVGWLTDVLERMASGAVDRAVEGRP
ncbi:transposase domain-containing protein [Azospirillum halopraeferens]|uniref:transposase domain-containing protein n=1 Tax=Azospirillum halopraeferens TaxID=34010 RepID=UPI0012EC6E95